MNWKLVSAVVVVALVGVGIWAARQYAARAGEDARAALTALNEPGEPAGGETLQLYKDPKKVPAFSVTTLDGRTITAESLRGHVTIINFWATWCPPCREEIPDLVALQQKYGDKVMVLGLSTDEGPTDTVKAFVDRLKINYPVAVVGEDIERLFAGVTSLPTSFIVDRDGNMVQKHVGMLNARLTERETRVLAGLDTGVQVERIDADKPVGLENAAQVREIPGVELAAFSPEKRVEAIQKLNADSCTCGCGLTVARCRVDDPQCSVSLPLARKIVAAIARN